ncbi:MULTISPECIES: roadblock/LC7 domain-containing protein [Streptomyces]|uniref:Predicted regulator of Ras-like GTPase activity, Roadblock/LC7/MglB family n=2 Tax=Streptomyces TaxID=1883 RepID=A0A286DLL1_9ACTN|nr:MULTISPECIES: roadblock/LC7 domain-containing protein [Streptomyces]TNM34180.1 roadblock/LC7 domain-containing protein [Streptomyces sedi]SOD59536.1 Predicted regulator of Ras-like GTPase activity, Roadblock/LC7/MglB family [Streptomyces zhaozhouensis]
MSADLSWVLNDVLEVRGARHAILVSADGLLMQRSDGIDRDDAERNAAAMSSLQSLCRSVASFLGDGGHWKQTLIEFDGGWIFLIAGGSGSYLAVSTTLDVDMEAMSIRMQKTTGALAKAMSAAPRLTADSDA